LVGAFHAKTHFSLELAQRRGATLATLDQQLSNAAASEKIPGAKI
jgi:hypothetical protein